MDKKTTFDAVSTYKTPVIRVYAPVSRAVFCASDYGESGQAATAFDESNTINYDVSF